MFANDDIEKQLRLSTDPVIETFLPLGPYYDDYTVTVYAKIFDRKEAFTLVNIASVKVTSATHSEVEDLLFSSSVSPHDVMTCCVQVLPLPTSEVDSDVDELLAGNNISLVAAEGDLGSTTKSFLRYADLLNMANRNDASGKIHCW